MTKESASGRNKLAAKEYLTLSISALALVVSAARFYFQFLKVSHALYVGISNAQISLSVRPKMG
jgi:hypothetical protein